MKLDDEQSGLARVDKTAPANMTNSAPRRSVPMKRTNERPSTEQLTPAPLTGTAKVKAELDSVLVPIFDRMADDEHNAAVAIVNNLIPRAIAARSAQAESNIAANVRRYGEEVVAETLDTFPAVDASNTVLLLSMADTLFGQLFPGEVAV